jgi:putative transcriptional regulator
MNCNKKVLEEKRMKQNWLAEKFEKSDQIINGLVQDRKKLFLEVLFEIGKLNCIDPKELLVTPTLCKK